MVSPKKKNIAMVCGTALAIFVASAVYISHGKQEKKKNVLTTSSSSGGLRFSRALQEVVPPLSWLGMEKEEDEMKSDYHHHQEDDDAALHKSLRNLGMWKQHKKKMREEKKKAKDTTDAVVVESAVAVEPVAEAVALVESSTTTAEANTEEVSLIFNLCVESVTYFFLYTNIHPLCSKNI